MTGVELIAQERQRQIDEEGYTAEHDEGHADELAQAAATYATPDIWRPARLPWQGSYDDMSVPPTWPWLAADWKPGDRVRELVKAGALIAAAIDSLQAEHGGEY